MYHDWQGCKQSGGSDRKFSICYQTSIFTAHFLRRVNTSTNQSLSPRSTPIYQHSPPQRVPHSGRVRRLLPHVATFTYHNITNIPRSLSQWDRRELPLVARHHWYTSTQSQALSCHAPSSEKSSEATEIKSSWDGGRQAEANEGLPSSCTAFLLSSVSTQHFPELSTSLR